MNLFLDTINSIAPFATIASTILITYVLYKKTASEKAIVKGIKIDKKENLNLGYAEKIIIEIDELENNVNELINSNLEALKDILAEVKKLKTKQVKENDLSKIIDNKVLELDKSKKSISRYQSIDKFYKLIRIDRNINGGNVEIDSAVEEIKKIIGVIQYILPQIDTSSSTKDEVEVRIKYIMEKYDGASDIKGYLEDSVKNIISVCKERML